MIGKQFFPSSSLRSIFPCVRLPLGNRLNRRKSLKIQASRLRSATERRAKKGARRDSKSVGGDTVWVRVPPPAPGPEPSLVERLWSFSFPRLQAMGQNPVTIRYNSRHNMNLGSLAKEAVDIRIGDRVFLAMEVVENGYHTYHDHKFCLLCDVNSILHRTVGLFPCEETISSYAGAKSEAPRMAGRPPGGKGRTPQRQTQKGTLIPR